MREAVVHFTTLMDRRMGHILNSMHTIPTHPLFAASSCNRSTTFSLKNGLNPKLNQSRVNTECELPQQSKGNEVILTNLPW